MRRSLPVALAALLALGAAGEPEIVRSVAISDELKVGIARGDLVFLYARPLPGEGLDAFVRRFTQDPATKARILELNSEGRLLRRDAFIRVPYDLLADNYKKIAIEALFPADSGNPEGWEHTVTAPTREPESLWRIAEWFTGDGANYARIRKVDHLASLETERGQRILIPADLLLPAFRAEAVGEGGGGKPPLTYGKDRSGPYAAYRLRKGEALYSSVVVRFTGLIYAEEVNAEAAKIARRSGIENVRAIPEGFAVRIPLSDLLPEYLPARDPRRVEYERRLLETAQFANPVRARRLSGVTVVLDPGHGGADTGAYIDGVAEARYVYDIALRIVALLKRETRASVVLTVRDPTVRGVSPGDDLRISRGARVMTTPPYPIEDTVAGVHLRWYLANAILSAARKKGRDPTHVVFVSLHADSLHPSVRGAMVYVPGARFLSRSFGKTGKVYEARREYRSQPRVSFSRRERLEAEGISRRLADDVLARLRSAHLPVHEYNPVRENVIRGGREWVPAVLRYNEIPARILLEVCNLNNGEDRRLIQEPSYREAVAANVVAALGDFYDGAASGRRAGARVSGTRAR